MIVKAIKNRQYIQVNRKATEEIILVIFRDIGFDSEFGLKDVKELLPNKKANTLSHNLRQMAARSILHTSLVHIRKRTYYMPSKSKSGNLSKAYKILEKIR